MWLKKVFIFSVVTFISAFNIGEAFIYNQDDTELDLGANCLHRNNEQGYCEEFEKCEYAQLLYHVRKSSELKFCKFVGKRPLVCCVSIPKLTNPAVSNPSSKFQNALCKNVQTEQKVNNFISKGVMAEVGEFPFQAAIGYKSGDGKSLEFNCGGSLIADDIILTAANCVNRKNRVPIMARLGRTSLDLNDSNDNTTAQNIAIEVIRIHPKYTRRYRHNDIALIKLKKPFVPSNSVGTICLSTNDKIVPKDFTITGFNRVNQFAKKRSSWLLKGKVSEYPLDKCKEKLFSTAGVKIADSQFCAASTTGVDVCRGDLGSPLSYIQNNVFYLQAITSYGATCGSSYPAIYTRVSKFLDWIEAEMNSLV